MVHSFNVVVSVLAIGKIVTVRLVVILEHVSRVVANHTTRINFIMIEAAMFVVVLIS